MTFPHAGQSSLFFNNMFVLLDIVQKLHNSGFEIFTSSFFMALEVFKEKSKNIENKKRRLKSLFSNRFWIVLRFTILESFKKFIFKKFIDFL
jgi:magnesium-transporting ATPase (P-type)